MEKIEKIRDFDDQIFEEFKKYFLKLHKSNFSKKFPKTLHISNLFTTSTNFIKNSIFDCSETDDLFGVKILFRSLIEHYLRFQYVNFNWIKSKSDDSSEKYIQFTQAKEILDQIKSSMTARKQTNSKFEMPSWQQIFDDIPSLKKFTKKEIEIESVKYTYKNIIKTLKEIDKNSETGTTFWGNLIIEYSKLSAFVHGGAGAHNQMIIFNNEMKRMDEYARICGLAYQMAATVKLLTLIMIIQTDKKEFEEHYLALDKLIKKVNQI